MSKLRISIVFINVFIILIGCRPKDSYPSGFTTINQDKDGIVIDLRYYGNDNFTGNKIRGYEGNSCVITTHAAQKLKEIQNELVDSGLGLKIFDAYRPQSAVNYFMEWAEDLGDTIMKQKYYPDIDKSELFELGYIASKSGHSRGSTVDLTIIDLKTGKELNMGTKWDHFGVESHFNFDSLTNDEKYNRSLLRSKMIQYGFKPLDEEWWHFTLKEEPFPETYFDFPIK